MNGRREGKEEERIAGRERERKGKTSRCGHKDRSKRSVQPRLFDGIASAPYTGIVGVPSWSSLG